MTPAEDLLKQNNLRLTNARREVLSVFLDNPVAHSHADIEVQVDGNIDRVTIYRTLDSFLASGLIHKIPDDSGAAKYALCDGCTEHHHHDNHVHFKCRKCGISECLIELHVPSVSVPAGYTVENENLLLEGVCVRCSK